MKRQRQIAHTRIHTHAHVHTYTRTHTYTYTRTRIYNTRLFNIFLKLRIFLWLPPQFFLGRRGTFLEAKLSYKTFIIKPNFGIVRHQFWQYLNSFWQSIICRWIILTMKKLTTILPILWKSKTTKTLLLYSINRIDYMRFFSLSFFDITEICYSKKSNFKR